MKLTYETDRLLLKILRPTPENAVAVLDFYNRNQLLFERYEQNDRRISIPQNTRMPYFPVNTTLPYVCKACVSGSMKKISRISLSELSVFITSPIRSMTAVRPATNSIRIIRAEVTQKRRCSLELP